VASVEGEQASHAEGGVLGLVLLIVAWMILILLSRAGSSGA
jgi:hypothetical protein